MSASSLRRAEIGARAAVFAALGDATRLALVGKLAGDSPQPIARLAEGSTITRQAITKHLRVLEGAGVVSSVRIGRETVFAFRPEPLRKLQSYIDHVSEQWDRPLARLKAFVEGDEGASQRVRRRRPITPG